MAVASGGDTTHIADSNGRISSGVASGNTASLTVTNAAGNTHGIVIDENKVAVTGGANSTSLILNDDGARFSDDTTGAPVTVTGVADGVNANDAVNYNQLERVDSRLSGEIGRATAYLSQEIDGVASGVAGVAAMANIPPVDPGKRFSIGIGFGNFADQSSVAFGASVRGPKNLSARVSVGTDIGSTGKSVVGAGLGWSW